MADLGPLLWLIPTLPLVGFLVNGGVYLATAPRNRADAGGHGHDDHHGAHGDSHGHAGGGAKVDHGQMSEEPTEKIHHADDHDHGHDAHAGHDHGHEDHGHGAHAHPTGGPTHGLPAAAIAGIGVVGPLIAFVLSVLVFGQVHEGVGAMHTFWHWLTTGNLDVGFGLQADALTSSMLLFVTGIGTLIHLYSYGYMHEDPGVAKFFAYLNLFLASMLILILGDSLPMLFVGWEGVGLCSYLLIGFWYDDNSTDASLASSLRSHPAPWVPGGFANVDAGRKAFVANRVGDFAFLIGMFTLFSLAGGLDFHSLATAVSGDGGNVAKLVASGPFAGWTVGGVVTLATLCLFIGATGKSAQIPLYVWLPDAMAGPTPVSALIHAATMVTAGVYMIGRLNFLYVMVPQVTAIVGFVAAATALLSGIIAVAQNDIKKVLAYSTVSQLGFMFCGMATTYFASGLFHVITHAFFKALLFLGAGAVIHALGNEQDIRKMGGLYKDMPLVTGLFLIGSAALAGVPPFAGFWSKDEIMGNVNLLMTHEGGLWTATFVMLLITAVLTAFYTTRLVIVTFFGKPHDPNRHPHATHWTMMLPLVVLATLALVGGAIGGPLERFTEPLWHPNAVVAALSEEDVHHAHQMALIMSLVAVVVGVGSSVVVYGFARQQLQAFVEGPGKALHALVENKFYVDEIYDALIVVPIREGAKVLWANVDRAIIDGGMVEGSAKAVQGVGGVLRLTQAGTVNADTAAMVIGTLAILGYLVMTVVTHG